MGLYREDVFNIRNKPHNTHQKVFYPCILFLIILRLEAATSRLEDLAVANTNEFREAQAHRSSTTPSLSKEPTPQFNTGVFTPEARSSVVEEAVIEEEKSPVVADYEKLISDLVDTWAAKSEKIDTIVGEQVIRV